MIRTSYDHLSCHKGRAFVIKDCETYLSKMQQQLDEGDCIIDNWKEKTLLDKLHKKIISQLKAMGIDMDDFKQKRKLQHQCSDICIY